MEPRLITVVLNPKDQGCRVLGLRAEGVGL